MTVQPIQRPEPQDRKRPAKQAERVKARKQKVMDAQAVGMVIDGVEYVINPSDLTGRVEFEIRRECGMGIAEIGEAMERTRGVDYLGMFMWAVRYARGEDVDLMDVLDSVSAASDGEVMTPEEVEAALAASPKGSGKNSARPSPA